MTPVRIPVSVIIMTKNEERVLARTLGSVRDFDQVFVIDSHSTDATVAIAKKNDAEVVSFTWDGQYPKKKEWALLTLPFRNDWVLYLDADERVTPELIAEMRQLFESGYLPHVAYDVHLDYFFLGRLLRHGHKVTKRVLLRRDRMAWPRPDDLGAVNMWEVEGHYQPTVDGSVGKLTSSFQHDDPDPLYDYFARHNRYSDWEAHLLTQRERADDVREARSRRGRRYASVPFKPAAFFFYSYVAKRGFLDGKAGFHYAIAHAFYFWQISVKKAENTAKPGIPAQRTISLSDSISEPDRRATL